MPRGVRKQNRMYEATMSFASAHGDAIAGLTRVAENHPLVKAYPDWFRALEDGSAPPAVEAATAAPGEARGDDE